MFKSDYKPQQDYIYIKMFGFLQKSIWHSNFILGAEKYAVNTS